MGLIIWFGCEWGKSSFKQLKIVRILFKNDLMKKYIIFFLICLGCAALYFFILQDYSQQKSSLIFNGTILTMDKQQPEVEAIFVEDGIIQQMGSYKAIKAFQKSDTEIIDLNGRTLLPGFIDSHTHPVISTFLHSLVDMSGFTHASKEAVWTHLNQAIPSFKKGEWIVAKGFDPILVEGLKAPHISYLDSIAPDHPLLIISQSMHSYWANTLAFERCGINKDSPNPTSASYYGRDSLGELTGFIAEQEAFHPFRDQLLIDIGKDAIVQTTVDVLDDYAKKGYTSITALGATTDDPNVVLLYRHLSAQQPSLFPQLLAKAGILPARKAAIRHFMFIRQDAAHLLPDSPDNGDDGFKILGIKMWYDGSPYTGSMYIEEPYMESELTQKGFLIPKHYHGEALIDADELKALISNYQDLGWQVAIHAQGDLAIAEIMNTYEQLNNMASDDYRHRLEHCLLLSESSIKKMKNLGVHPSFHINHLYYYGQSLRDDIIGLERAEKILPVQSAVAQNLVITLHADQPMFESEPLSLLHTAVNRQTTQGDTIGLFHAIDVQSGLEALTINAAWQIKMDDKIGSLQVGKYADFTILNKNPLHSPKEALRMLKVEQTIVNGNTIFKED